MEFSNVLIMYSGGQNTILLRRGLDIHISEEEGVGQKWEGYVDRGKIRYKIILIIGVYGPP